MSEEDAGNRLRVLVKAVSDDLWIAVATFEVYAPSAFDAALIDKVNEREVYPAFNVISEALEATTISTLCRIWDKTSDAARIAEIEKLLRKRPDLAGDSGALRRWLGGVEMVEKSEELQALRAIRNMRLAHTHDPNRLDFRLLSGVRNAAIEDEWRLLEATILVVQQLHGLIGSPDPLDYRLPRSRKRLDYVVGFGRRIAHGRYASRSWRPGTEGDLVLTWRALNRLECIAREARGIARDMRVEGGRLGRSALGPEVEAVAP